MKYAFESDIDELSDEALKYVGVTNLDFKTHLSSEELSEVQDIIFSINTLLQITFKDGTEVEDIENIKHMLELSPMCDDQKIEKLILRRNTIDEVKYILSLPYQNPDTWHIAYDIKDDTYMLTTLPNYRIMEEYMSLVLTCIKKEMSPLEKIKEVYDFVKLLEYDDSDNNRIPDIIKSRKTGNLGFNLLFSEILKRIGIKSFIGEIKRGKKEYITIVNVVDNKYGANGIYVFDPASDSIPKEAYKHDALRKINYNFFALSLNDVINTVDGDELLGVLDLINSQSFEYAERRIEYKQKEKIEKDLGKKFNELFDIVKQTKRISDNKLLDLFISTIHDDDFFGLNRDSKELISNNYFLRKKEIFKKNNDENIDSVIIHDI